MKIDLSKFSEAELIDLNQRIVERLRILSQMRTHEQMLQFHIGERVTFHPEGHDPIVGMITRYNKKTVTVITDEGHHWNVHPRFLRKVVSENAKKPKNNVVRFKKD